MATDRERKIPNNVSLTARQTQLVDKEAKRVGISFSEQLRRIVDEWGDRKYSMAGKIYAER